MLGRSIGRRSVGVVHSSGISRAVEAGMFESDLPLPRGSCPGSPSSGVCAQSEWVLLPRNGRLHQWLAGPPVGFYGRRESNRGVVTYRGRNGLSVTMCPVGLTRTNPMR